MYKCLNRQQIFHLGQTHFFYQCQVALEACHNKDCFTYTDMTGIFELASKDRHSIYANFRNFQRVLSVLFCVRAKSIQCRVYAFKIFVVFDHWYVIDWLHRKVTLQLKLELWTICYFDMANKFQLLSINNFL